MGKNLDAKCKQCRRVGEKLFLKGERCSSPKCAMVKRNYPPGPHGPKGRKRSSDYGLQLNEKQKARKFYGLNESQFKISFSKVQKKGGDVGNNFLRFLEMRLDNVVYRAGLASSRVQARQLVNHGHFTVNDRKVNIPSYQVKIGQIIKVKKSSKENRQFKNLPEKLKTMLSDQKSWLATDSKDLSVKVLHEPRPQDLPLNIKTHMIIEFYSK
ncbi:MAG: 30S ribosomal protein S4 [Patescibacteria group bacterium]|nr:30S ribosomal protein S4 [Patescibacteria group bacterium]